MTQTAVIPQKSVHVIPAQVNIQDEIKSAYRQLRVAAYCRVSTKEEEQLNSYEVQTKYYIEKINSEPKWSLVEIFADKGISGTSLKKRDEFKRMIKMCKRGKIDMIITKSISRFARNTVDCLESTRLLKELGVDVFFEEQGIHSTDPGAEFYITIYGSIAQSESENISANVKWGKAQSAKEGNVPFQYKRFLGYRKGADGKPEIDPEQAETVKRIYERFLAGDSLAKIAEDLNTDGVPTPSDKGLDQNDTEDKSLDIQIRIAEIDAEFHKMLKAISADTVESFDETKATELMNEKSRLEQQLAQYAEVQQKRENAKSRLDEIYTILDGLKNHPLTYDDQIIRQILECVVVESKEKIKVVFVGGLKVEQMLN